MAKRLEAIPTENNINLDSRLFNKVYYPLLFRVYNYMVLYGGSGSGKSTFVAQMLAVQMTIFAGRNLACLRKQKTDCIASCFGEIYHYIKKFKLKRYWIVRTNPDHRMINRINGNQIIFEGVDSIEDIKSIKFVNETDNDAGDDNLTDVWYEEVNAEKDVEVIRELDRRIRDPKIKGRIILTFNPVLRSHWLYDLVMKEWQMEGVDSFVLKTTYKDNAFRPKEYDAKLERYQFTDPYAYQVYTLGEWGTTGQSVFDKNVVYNRLQELGRKYSKEPYITGYFDFAVNESGLVDEDNTSRPITFNISGDGEVKIFKDVEYRHPYVLAVDTAGEGSDFYSGQVCDNITGEQVAVFHSDKNPDRCIEQVYCLACYYNHALYCPETNFDSYAVKYFTMLNYPNIYRRSSPLDKTHIKREDRYGFRTGVDNRQAMLTELVKFVNDNAHLINDPATLDEMLTFTRQEKKLKGIWWGAENGAHDDLVMSMAILLQARSQQSMEMVTDTRKLSGYYTREELNDMLDEGRIDRFAMQEYIRTHDLYMESQESIRNYNGKRRSRYAS